MKEKSVKRIGFWMALAMLVGSIVGVGIFFKSHGVLRSNDWNGIGTLLAWVIGGLLSLGAAVSFGEIGSFKTKNVHGLAGWSEKVGGKKYGYFVRFNFSFFYYGLLTAVLGVFGSEMIFNMVTTFGSKSMSDFPIYTHIIIGLFISLFFLGLNIVSVRTSGWIALVSTILKWVPLVIVAFSGIILATTNNLPSASASDIHAVGHNAFTNGHSFTFTGMLAALPAVLFAFDAFIGVGSMRDKMKEPKKLSLVIVVGMISVLTLYLLIAISAILHGTGMVSGMPFGKGAQAFGIFGQIFSASAADAMGKFVVIFIAISTFGVINGISAVAVSTHEQAIASNTIFGIKKSNSSLPLVLYTLIITVFWTLVFGIPAIILKSDSVVDGISNFPTLFMFAIYGGTILLYTLKRDKMDTVKMKDYVFKAFAWLSIVGIFLVVAYQLIYGFLINAIINPELTTHWGLYAGDNGGSGASVAKFPTSDLVPFGVYMSLGQAAIIFFAMVIIFFAVPLLNLYLSKKLFKREVVIDTQQEVSQTE